MSNTITIELSKDDRDRLDSILYSLTELVSRFPKAGVAAVTELKPADLPEVKNEPEPEAVNAKADELPELPVDEPVPFEDPKPEPVKPIALGEFQKQIVAMCVEHPDKKPNIQAVVKGYAKCVSAIPEDKRAEVLRRLEDLING